MKKSAYLRRSPAKARMPVEPAERPPRRTLKHGDASSSRSPRGVFARAPWKSGAFEIPRPDRPYAVKFS